MNDACETASATDRVATSRTAARELMERSDRVRVEAEDLRALAQWLGLRAGEPVPDRRAIARSLVLGIAQIDRWVSSQVSAILDAPQFRELESNWRGLEELVRSLEARDKVRVRLLDVSWRVLAKDLDKAIEFDQSALFIKVYSDEFGTPGGQPFGVLLGAYSVSHRPRVSDRVDDVRALRSLAQIAAAAFSPLLLGGDPSLFGVDSFAELGHPDEIARLFAQQDYVGWNSVRALEDSRFLGVVVPRVLLRRPVGEGGTTEVKSFRYRHVGGAMTDNGYLFGNPVFSLGRVITRAFEQTGWLGDIRGVTAGELSGGLLQGLEGVDFLDAAGAASKPQTDAVITDEMERALADVGVISVCACKGTSNLAVYSVPSLQNPDSLAGGSADANARLSAMLQHILCTSRIAHCLKMMCRDKVGSFTEAKQIQAFIQSWLFDLTTDSENGDPATLAKFPLGEASVRVEEIPGRPGCYSSVIHLRPHFQLDQLSSSIRLVTEILTGK